MRTPDPRNDKARGQAGDVGEAVVEVEIDKANGSAHGGNNIIALPGRRGPVRRCQHCGNILHADNDCPNGCASNLALVARIEQRRSDSLRLQSMGELMRAGA